MTIRNWNCKETQDYNDNCDRNACQRLFNILLTSVPSIGSIYVNMDRLGQNVKLISICLFPLILMCKQYARFC